MPGSSSITGLESISFTDNMSFDGTERGGALDTDGQVWMGATASPHVRKTDLASNGSLTLAFSEPTATTGLLTISIDTPVTVSNGGTGAITLLDGGILLGAGTSAITALDLSAKGSLVVGDGTTAPSALAVGTDGYTIIADSAEATGIKWAPAVVPGGVTSWVEETTTSRALLVNQGVVGNNAATILMTLPAASAFGDIIKIVGKGAGKWKIAQNAGNTIYFGSSTTTPGVTGYIESTLARDCVELVCVTANSDWEVISSIGNITVF